MNWLISQQYDVGVFFFFFSVRTWQYCKIINYSKLSEASVLIALNHSQNHWEKTPQIHDLECTLSDI